MRPLVCATCPLPPHAVQVCDCPTVPVPWQSVQASSRAMVSFFTVPRTASQNVISIWYSRLEPGFGARRRFSYPAASAKILAEEIAKARTAARAATASSKIESPEIEMHLSALARPRHAARARRLKAELIVHLAFLGVGQNVVGFLHLLEFFFRGFVAGIQIRVIFARKFPVGRTDFLLRRLARDAQKFVVILFRRGSHVLVTDDP